MINNQSNVLKSIKKGHLNKLLIYVYNNLTNRLTDEKIYIFGVLEGRVLFSETLVCLAVNTLAAELKEKCSS